jgi:hypothetical protein
MAADCMGLPANWEERESVLSDWLENRPGDYERYCEVHRWAKDGVDSAMLMGGPRAGQSVAEVNALYDAISHEHNKERIMDYSRRHRKLLGGLAAAVLATAGTFYVGSYLLSRDQNEGGNAEPTVSPSPTSGTIPDDNEGLLVPLYIYPGNEWNTLSEIKKSHPSLSVAAIVNPSSGSGEVPNPEYASHIADLKLDGIDILGYVPTSYGCRNSSDVMKDIDNYLNWYGVDGIFLDEMSPKLEHREYYGDLNSYIHASGMKLSVGNPGNDLDYADTDLDIINVYADSGMPSAIELQRMSSKFDGKISYVAHGVEGYISTKPNSLFVKYQYLTDDVQPNPWDTLPPYLSRLASDLEIP